MKKLLNLLIIILILGAGYYYKDNIIQNSQALYELVSYAPCQRPITYSIGTFDNRFGLSQDAFKQLADSATTIWKKAAGKNLFAYSETGGDLTINLIYDYRQEATNKMQSIGIEIHNNKSTYDNLEAKHDSMVEDYNKQKNTLDKMISDYQAQKKSYENEVTSINIQGGASTEQYKKLEQKRNSLNVQVQKINQTQSELKNAVANINASVTLLNGLAFQLNLNVGKYNNVGTETGNEFDEAVYEGNPAQQGKIDIYQFENKEKLLRVLVHEMGHALGLGHVDNPDAVMYKINQGNKAELTTDDINALKSICAIN